MVIPLYNLYYHFVNVLLTKIIISALFINSIRIDCCLGIFSGNTYNYSWPSSYFYTDFKIYFTFLGSKPFFLYIPYYICTKDLLIFIIKSSSHTLKNRPVFNRAVWLSHIRNRMHTEVWILREVYELYLIYFYRCQPYQYLLSLISEYYI